MLANKQEPASYTTNISELSLQTTLYRIYYSKVIWKLPKYEWQEPDQIFHAKDIPLENPSFYTQKLKQFPRCMWEKEVRI